MPETIAAEVVNEETTDSRDDADENFRSTGKEDPSWQVVKRVDLASGELGERRTQQGGLVARAKLTRTGVFQYRQPDGSIRRELRHPDEVFDKDSLDSLAHATVTDDHPDKVTPHNWKQVAIGHVAGRPKKAGDFVAQDVHIQHDAAIDKAQKGKLQEASCGYECAIDPTPGTYDGEPYDAIQRRIRYNHVALGPPGWGRAGPEVRLHLDSGAGVSVGSGDTPTDSPEQTHSKAAFARSAEVKAFGDHLQPSTKKEHGKLADAHKQAAEAHDYAALHGDPAQKDAHQKAATDHYKVAKSEEGMAEGSSDSNVAQSDAADAVAPPVTPPPYVRGMAVETEVEQVARLDSELRTIKAENERLRGENDVLKTRTDNETRAGQLALERQRLDSAFDTMLEAIDAGRTYIKKFTRVREDGAYKTIHDVRREVIAALEPGMHLDAKASDDYVAGVYEATIRRAREAERGRNALACASSPLVAPGIAGLRGDALRKSGGMGGRQKDPENEDDDPDDEHDDAITAQMQKNMFQKQKDAWKKKKDRRASDGRAPKPVPAFNGGNQGDFSGGFGGGM